MQPHKLIFIILEIIQNMVFTHKRKRSVLLSLNYKVYFALQLRDSRQTIHPDDRHRAQAKLYIQKFMKYGRRSQKGCDHQLTHELDRAVESSSPPLLSLECRFHPPSFPHQEMFQRHSLKRLRCCETIWTEYIT